MSDWGVYVHVPFCRVRCPYCAFSVEPDKPDEHADFVAKLRTEWQQRRSCMPAHPPLTLAFGGGTPSRLDPTLLATLVQAIGPTGEVSLEANPEDVDERWLEGVLRAGVQRLSLGVQTFDPDRARLLNRAHTVRQAQQTAALVANSGVRSWSIDVIFGLPGQTPADFARDLDALVETGAPHVALYGLTYEPGTPLGRAHAQGRFSSDDEAWREMYDHAVATLRDSGLQRYEVSNFARPGHESAHNRLYWTDAPYLGLGPAAHSYLPDGSRTENPAARTDWVPGETHLEAPDPTALATDLLVSGLRGVGGIAMERLVARTGLRPAPATLRALRRQGLLEPDRMALTDSGFPVADGVIRTLVGSLQPAD